MNEAKKESNPWTSPPCPNPPAPRAAGEPPNPLLPAVPEGAGTTTNLAAMPSISHRLNTPAARETHPFTTDSTLGLIYAP